MVIKQLLYTHIHILYQISEIVSVIFFKLLTVVDHWAAEFLTLEKLYHERLVSNLASIQEQWGKHKRILIMQMAVC